MHVLVIQPIARAALALLDARAVSYEVLTDTRPEAIAARAADADAITIRDAPLPATALAGAARLKIISRHGVGFDNLPVAWASAHGVPVTIIGDVNAVSVAEHTLYLMLAVAKNGARFDRAVRAGDFAARSRHDSVELRGKTLLLVGHGRIAQALARRARALEMVIAAYDPFAETTRFPDVTFYPTLEAGLAHADVVSVHVPLGESTRGLIGATALAAIKPGAILLNAARGGIVDETALIAALESGRLRGAGMDVFAREPVVATDPLLVRDDVVLSPHSAALTADCLIEMGLATVRNVLAAFDGALDPALVVNRAALAQRAAS